MTRKTDRRASYTSANALPVKLFMSDGARRLQPVHINWYPTNECNLNCDFCSCSRRDKTVSMDMIAAVKVIHAFVQLGCRSVSISGGGEPLLHPQLTEMIAEFHSYGVKVGLVTNGTLLNRISRRALEMLQWCRISCSSPFDSEYMKVLDRAIQADVDWAFSHVVGKHPNLEHISQMTQYAQSRNFTHVRLVGDLKEPLAANWSGIKQSLAEHDGFVIYQERKEYFPSRQCLLGYVKPVVAPDWKMYLCCGVQYALRDMSLDNPQELCMGDARDLDAIYGGRRLPFAVTCERCYYENYNVALQALTSDVHHKDFV